MRISPKWKALPAIAWSACGLFIGTLALVLTRVVRVPATIVVGLAALALAASAAMVARGVLRLLRGPSDGFDPTRAVRCDGAAAERVRARAVRREAGGGSGFVRRWAAIFPVLAWIAATGVLTSGLLNVTMRIEGRWVAYAGSGRDLDLRETYRDLDVGLLADARDLRYGVLVGDVRPTSPARLADLEVVDASGRTVLKGVLGPRGALSVGSMGIHTWSFGPSVYLTVVHERGRLFDGPVPLWPAGPPGRFAERIEGDGVALEIAVDGWPSPDGAAGDPRVRLTAGNRVLFDGLVSLRKVYQGQDGYRIMIWEQRPWIGLAIAHRTYRQLTLASLGLLVLALAGSLVLPPRAFAYVEEESGIAVSPPAAWAKLTERA